MTKELQKLLGKDAETFESEENFFLEASRKGMEEVVVPASLDSAVKAAAAVAAASGKTSSSRTGRRFITWFSTAAAAFVVCAAIAYSMNGTEVCEDMQVTVALNAQKTSGADDDGIMAKAIDYDADLAEIEFAMANSVSDEDENGLYWISACENDFYRLYSEI